MKFSAWLIAIILTVAAAPALAAAPIGFGSVDGRSTVLVDQAHPLPVSVGLDASSTLTTPAGVSAYASGQLIANSATAGSVVPLTFAVCRDVGGSSMVRRARLKTPDTGFVNATVRLHLYKLLPTVANGDHAAFSSSESDWLDDVDVTLDHAFSDPYEKGVGVPAHGSEANFTCAAGVQTIYGLLEARGAITPQGAKTVTVTLEVLAN